MKPEDLRIGNLVQRLDGTFRKIDAHDLVSMQKNNTLKPQSIPITEEWLKKFGFEKANDLDEFYYLQIINDWTAIYYNTKHKICELSVSRHGSVIKIKSVHQLQNLYFALTEKELTFNQII